MPGSAGGHSGGFSGGGHSGGFSGGGHSGSFGGGSHGGFSGGSRSGGGFHSPNPGGGFHPHGGMGGGFYPWGQGGRRRRSGGGGCLSGILGILLLPLALVIFAVFAFTNLFGGSGSYTSTPDYYYDESVAMSSELVTYEKLSDSLCTPIEACIETDISDLLNEEGEAQIQKAIDYFYETTGVQPYFMLLGGINGDSDPDYDTIDNFLYNKYVSMFPEDEGHIILLMLLDGDDYTTWYIIGDDAYFVTDEYACETILNNIDYYAAFTNSTDIASVIADALTDTADDIMTDVEYFYSYPADYDYNFDRDINGITVSSAVPRISGLIFITVIIAVIVFAVWLNKKHKSSAPETPSGSTSAQGEKSYRQVNTDSTSTGSYDSRSYSPNKAAYPVRCPYCGATAYPKDDGTCEYCGSKLPE